MRLICLPFVIIQYDTFVVSFVCALFVDVCRCMRHQVLREYEVCLCSAGANVAVYIYICDD